MTHPTFPIITVSEVGLYPLGNGVEIRIWEVEYRVSVVTQITRYSQGFVVSYSGSEESVEKRRLYSRHTR